MLQRDFEELKNVIVDFHKITGITLSMYDENFNLIYSYPPNHSPFCRLIRSTSLVDKCCSCDKKAMLQCKLNKKSHVYKCHMGMIEAMTPITSSDTIIGYLLMGQIVPEHQDMTLRDRINSLPASIDISKEDLHSAIDKMQPISNDTLNAAVHIMNICASFISLNRFVLSIQNPIQHEIEKYIYDNISDPELSMVSICNHFLISRSSLYAISKNAYGIGISDYIRYCRIEHAKDLLAYKQHSIAEISRACGFNEANYFTKTFKQLTGILPKDYAASISDAK